jgi:hypothetical protein
MYVSLVSPTTQDRSGGIVTTYGAARPRNISLIPGDGRRFLLQSVQASITTVL